MKASFPKCYLSRRGKEEFRPKKLIGLEVTLDGDEFIGANWFNAFTGESLQFSDQGALFGEIAKEDYKGFRFISYDSIRKTYPWMLGNFYRYDNLWNLYPYLDNRLRLRLFQLEPPGGNRRSRRTFLDLGVVTGWTDRPEMEHTFSALVNMLGDKQVDDNTVQYTIMYDTFDKLIHQEFFINARYTIASTAIHALCRFLPPQSYYLHVHPQLEVELRKRGYMGGAQWCFKIGCEVEGHLYDVNSMFPYRMTFDLPQGKEYRTKSWNEEPFYILKVSFLGKETTVDDIPILVPYRTEYGRSTFSGDASETMWVTKYMYEYLLSKGYDISIEDNRCWNRVGNFAPFVEKLEEMRQEFPAGTPENWIAKMLGVSAYGKLGNAPEFKEYVITDHPAEGDMPLSIIHLMKQSQMISAGIPVSEEDAKFPDSLPIYERIQYRRTWFQQVHLAHAITEGARVYLYKSISSEIEAGNEVYFFETDCVHLRELAKTLPIDSSKFGYWKLVDSGKITYLSRNAYLFQGKETVKIHTPGIPHKRKEES